MSEPMPLSADAADAVDRYLVDTLIGEDPALASAVADQQAAGMPDIEVAPTGGKLLHLLARAIGARRVLEIGTLGGYSTIWLARALPDGGRVITIEAEPAHAAVARASIDRAGVGEKVEIRVGRGADVLPTLEDAAPFDLVFIDADKESNTIYLDWAARLGRPGALVIVDNVVRSGRVADPADDSAQVAGVRAGLAMLRDDPRFDATALQTLDAKGWDGIALAVLA
ncbi:MAG: O-methyltransferase [Microbacterium sp.]|uniref:O-methyltransferase n=1 Tax=Microbacterium sp. TaxID=51671 RepID=UPI0019CC6881|nr:O-methyltransferase [Microbacterium sp.]MBD3758466.1 O-methyltransferase [Microbacterium sp.]